MQATRRLKLCVGDGSCDGHNQFRDFYYETTLTDEQLRDLWVSATQEMGFDFLKQFEEYENNKLSTDHAEALSTYLGAVKNTKYENWFYPEFYAQVIADIVQQAMNITCVTGEFKLITDQTPDLLVSLSGGSLQGSAGYGLFLC